jgi:hypothetical protein
VCWHGVCHGAMEMDPWWQDEVLNVLLAPRVQPSSDIAVGPTVP